MNASAHVSGIFSVAILYVLGKWFGKCSVPFEEMFDHPSGQGSFTDDSEMYILDKKLDCPVITAAVWVPKRHGQGEFIIWKDAEFCLCLWILTRFHYQCLTSLF